MVSCRKFEKDVTHTRDGIKCTDCGALFHSLCLGDALKTRGSRTNWKCDDCAFDCASNSSKSGTDRDQGNAAVLEAIASLRSEINLRWDANDEKMGQIRADIIGMNREIASVKSDLNSIQIKNNKTELEVGRLLEDNKRLSEDLAAAKRDISELQQHTRKNNVIISGIPVLPRGADALEVVKKIADLIGVKYYMADINAAHFLPIREGKIKTQSIIVSFVTRFVKNEWITARIHKKQLNANELNSNFPSTPIYLNEQLTFETRKLFNEARAHLKDGKLSSVWTNDGRVMAKRSQTGRPFRVTSLRDLDQATAPQDAASVPAATTTSPPTPTTP